MTITIHSSCSFLGEIGRRQSATFCLSSARGCDVDGDVQKHATVAGRMLPNISALASITDHLWLPSLTSLCQGHLLPRQLCSWPLLLNVSPNPLLPGLLNHANIQNPHFPLFPLNEGATRPVSNIHFFSDCTLSGPSLQTQWLDIVPKSGWLPSV